MRDVLRYLAEREPGDLPVLSVYLDMRPRSTEETLAPRPGLTALRHRLREIAKTLGPRGKALTSLRSDTRRVQRYLSQTFPPSAQGLAVFACSGRDLFEAVGSGVPFEHQVSIGPVPDLFQLVRLQDDQEAVVVAVVNATAARVLVAQTGILGSAVEQGTSGEHSYRLRANVAMSRACFQRHAGKHRTDVVRETAAEITRLVQHERAAYVTLIGDASTILLLREALPDAVRLLAAERPLRQDVGEGRDESQEAIAAIFSNIYAENDRSLADQLVDAIRSDGLGVVGMERTRAALERGQVDVLMLAREANLSAYSRSELVHLAERAGADVDIVHGHGVLQVLGGVGALLRYRRDDAQVPTVRAPRR